MRDQNPSTGLTCKWVPRKRGINKNNFGYISPICQKPPPPWTYVDLIWHSYRGRRDADLIACDKLFGDRLRGVDSVGGRICRKLPLPIDRANRVNTGLSGYNLQGDTNSIAPRFCHISKFQESNCLLYSAVKSSSAPWLWHYFPKVHLQRPPNHHFDQAEIQHFSGEDMDKTYHSECTKTCHFKWKHSMCFRWRGLVPSSCPSPHVLPPHIPPLAPSSLLYPLLRPPEFQPDVRQCWFRRDWKGTN